MLFIYSRENLILQNKKILLNQRLANQTKPLPSFGINIGFTFVEKSMFKYLCTFINVYPEVAEQQAAACPERRKVQDTGYMEAVS